MKDIDSDTSEDEDQAAKTNKLQEIFENFTKKKGLETFIEDDFYCDQLSSDSFFQDDEQ